MFNVLKTFPSSVLWCTKSYDQTWSRDSGRNLMHDPSFSQSRPFFRLFHWHSQPLTPPQALNALVIDLPAGIFQQCCDPAVSISTILSHQVDHVGHKALFIRTALACPRLVVQRLS